MKNYGLICFCLFILFCLVSCGNHFLLRENINKKTQRNFVLAEIQKTLPNQLEVLILQSWNSKITISGISDSSITVRGANKKGITITFSKNDYLQSQKEDCNFCIEYLSVKKIKLDTFSNRLLDKRSKVTFGNLKRGDLVIIALNKYNEFYGLTGIFPFNKFNYNILEKRFISCLRCDYTKLNY